MKNSQNNPRVTMTEENPLIRHSGPALRLALILTLTWGIPTCVMSAPDETAEKSEQIEWLEWSPEVFRRAQEEGKPILLNVRAVWTRASKWIEENVYRNPEIVRAANEHWVPIRIDRDRRPDVDARYQHAVFAVTKSSGWPLLAMLNGHGEILLGKVYFPVEDRYDSRGLTSHLTVGGERYANNPNVAERQRQIVKVLLAQKSEEGKAPPPPGMLDQIGQGILKDFDPDFGGFGPAPRLLSPFTLELAAVLYHRTENPRMLQALLVTLQGMEQGAIYDRVGGGFHRISQDATWRNPAFEKLVNYNATMMSAYLLGYEATGDPDLRNVAERTLDYLLGTLAADEGGFFVAQHANVEADDRPGEFYSWKKEEFDTVVARLGKVHTRVAETLFEVTEEGDLFLGPSPRSLLYLAIPRDLAAASLDMEPEALRKAEAEIIEALAAVRGKRTAPPVEKDIYVDSSSIVAVSLLEAARVLDRPDAREAALATVDRLLLAIPEGGGLMHRVDPPPEKGYDPVLANDHVQLAGALLSAYEETSLNRYLEGAVEVMKRAKLLFWDPENGGFLDVVEDKGALGYLSIRTRSSKDTGYPALNSAAALVLDRLAVHTGDDRYRSDAYACIMVQVPDAHELDYRLSGLGLALDSYQRGITRYVIVGGESDKKVEELLAMAQGTFDPGKIVMHLVPGRDDDAIGRLNQRSDDLPYALMCVGETCSAPTSDPDGIASLSIVR